MHFQERCLEAFSYPFAAIVMSKLKFVMPVMLADTVRVNVTEVTSLAFIVCPA